jgi:vancomycin resistance protein VanK
LADPGIKRLTEIPSQQADPVGARVTSQLRDSGWLPQSPEDGFGAGHPQFT